MSKENDTSGMKKSQPKPQCIGSYSGLVDIVDEGGWAKFMEVRKGNLATSIKYVERGKEYIVPPRTDMRWLLPRANEVRHAYRNDTPDQLFKDLIAHHKKYSELPDSKYYTLLAAWDFASYAAELVEYLGMLYFYGDYGRGKTRTARAVIDVSYRGMVQVDVRPANIMRDANLYRPTFLFDVSEFNQQVERSDSRDIFLNRFERGATITRVNNPSNPPPYDRNRYEIYGGTIIVTNEAMPAVIESRAFPIVMPYATKNFPKSTREECLPLRERLVAWRAHTMGTVLPSLDDISRGRMNDISQPLRQIVSQVSPQHLKELDDLIMAMEKAQKDSRVYTLDSEIVSVIIDLIGGINSASLTVGSIGNKLNQQRRFENSRPIALPELGIKLTGLGFQRNPGHGSGRSIWVNGNLLRELALKFGVLSPPPVKASLPSTGSTTGSPPPPGMAF